MKGRFSKTKRLAGRIVLVLALLGFAGLSAYSSLLHNHDWAGHDSHPDCISCKWSQNKTSALSLDGKILNLTSVFFQPRVLATQVAQNVPGTFSNRSPPRPA